MDSKGGPAFPSALSLHVSFFPGHILSLAWKNFDVSLQDLKVHIPALLPVRKRSEVHHLQAMAKELT